MKKRADELNMPSL